MGERDAKMAEICSKIIVVVLTADVAPLQPRIGDLPTYLPTLGPPAGRSAPDLPTYLDRYYRTTLRRSGKNATQEGASEE